MPGKEGYQPKHLSTRQAKRELRHSPTSTRRNLLKALIPGAWIPEFARDGMGGMSRAATIGMVKDVAITAPFIAPVLTASPQKPPAKPTPAPAPPIIPPQPEKSIDADKVIISEKAKAQGVRTSSKEKSLWNSGYVYSNDIKPINKETIVEAYSRIWNTLDLMAQSENPYFKESSQYLESLLQEGTVSIMVMKDNPPGQEDVAMALSAYNLGGKYHIVLSINANEPLNNLTPTDLAFYLTHEVNHIKNALAPKNLSIEERVKIVNELHIYNSSEYEREEARAYGAQAEATIYQYGLGYRVVEYDKKRTAAYIRSDSNPASPQWIKYVTEEILAGKRLHAPTPTPAP